jgi:cytoskeletal protein CcmA (bactofilin family)
MAVKSRAELKARFQRNKIPSEIDFAELIDSAMNQADDGVRKTPGDPLNIKGEGATQEVLAIYKSFEEKQIPAWKINQNPGDNTTPGLNIADKDGKSRLFIDEKSGTLTVGGTKSRFAGELGTLQLGDYTAYNNPQLLMIRSVDANRSRGFKIGVTDECCFNIVDLGHINNDQYYERLKIDYDGTVYVKNKLDITGDALAGSKLTVNGLLEAKGDTTTNKLTVNGALVATGDTEVNKLTVNEIFEARKELVVNSVLEARGDTKTNKLTVNGPLVATSSTEVNQLTVNELFEARKELVVNGIIEARSTTTLKGALGVEGIPTFHKTVNLNSGFKMNGGVMKWGDGDVAATSDPGIYSTDDGIYMKFATKRAPILFYNNKVDEVASAGNPTMVIAANGTVGIGTPLNPYAVGTNKVLQIGDDRVVGAIGQIILGMRHTTGATRSFKLGMLENGCFSLGDYGNSNPEKIYTEHLNIHWSTGNVGIGNVASSKLDVNGTLHIAGVANESNFPVQGTYITWNKENGQGRTHFINHSGNGQGGFIFENRPNTTDVYSNVAFINDLGDLFLKGDNKGHKSLNGSDVRIKANIQSSNGARDLALLNKLRVTDYDYLAKGKRNDHDKGVIAQEIENLIPEAVSKDTDFVANIFAEPVKTSALDKEVMFTMAQPHHLVDGDRVRLILPNGDTERIVTIVDETSFKIDGNADSFKDVLVYGKQVNDFRRVNYNHLFTLNLSATQELSKKIDILLAWKASLEKSMVLAD